MFALIFRSTASCRTVGNLSPTFSRPVAIATRIARSSWAYNGVGSFSSIANMAAGAIL